MSSGLKIKFSNQYIFETWWCKYFKLRLFDPAGFKVWKIKELYPVSDYNMGFKNPSLRQRKECWGEIVLFYNRKIGFFTSHICALTL